MPKAFSAVYFLRKEFINTTMREIIPPIKWAQCDKTNRRKNDPDGLLYLPPKTIPLLNRSFHPKY